jgi:hypothetical protein
MIVEKGISTAYVRFMGVQEACQKRLTFNQLSIILYGSDIHHSGTAFIIYKGSKSALRGTR